MEEFLLKLLSVIGFRFSLSYRKVGDDKEFEIKADLNR